MPISDAPTVDLFRHAQDVECFSAGQVILHEGDVGEVVYVVKQGTIDIVVRGTTVETLGPGGVFGEMALIDRQPRSAAAIAATDCELVSIDPQRFLRLVQQTPFFAIEIMRVMAYRLRQMNVRA